MKQLQKRLSYVFIVLAILVLHNLAGAQLKIMPLGDSITQGVINYVSQVQSLSQSVAEKQISYRADGARGVLIAGSGGYRLVLEQMLVGMNWDVQMVGQRTDGGGYHEGYPGYMTGDLLPLLGDILLANPPDVVLLHIGTNDLPFPIDPDSCFQNIRAMLDIIHAFNPDIKIILAQIIPCLQNTPLGTSRYPAIIELNSLLTQIPQQRDYVALVDMWTGFVTTNNWENTLMSGTFHPNDAGYYLMAEMWRDKLDLVIDGISPLVSGVFPQEGYNDEINFSCTIAGDFFKDGIDVFFHHNLTATDLYAATVIFESANRIHADFDLTQGFPGEWEVIAVNPNLMRSIFSPGIIVTMLDASGRADILGTIGYANSGRPVPQAVLTLDHREGVATDTTQNSGDYRFDHILLDSTTLLPSKRGDQRGGITGSDVILILQYLAFISNLNREQFIAADVTEDGMVTGSDAQAMLRYLAFYLDNIGATGRWRFDPADTSFMLNSDSMINFEAFLKGDVNLSWAQVSEEEAVAIRKNESSAESEVALSLAQYFRSGTGEIFIPVQLTHIEDPVQSIVFTISYDQNEVQYLTTKKSIISDSFMFAANGENPGKIHIATAGIEGIETDGEILRLCFRLKNSIGEEDNQVAEITAAWINDSAIDFSDKTRTHSENSIRKELPKRFRLSQNYPNPFNPSTMIHYQLEHASRVSLVIFDLAGRKVKTLVNDYQNAGWYQIQWDGLNEQSLPLNSGIYFCRLRATGFSQTIKMELIH